jgi:hypothetical protein
LELDAPLETSLDRCSAYYAPAIPFSATEDSRTAVVAVEMPTVKKRQRVVTFT